MSFRTLFFAMLYINGLLTSWLIDEWRKPSPCAVVVDSAVHKPAFAAPADAGGK